jgi:hypothetical protein
MACRTGPRQQGPPVLISMLTIPTGDQTPLRLVNQALPPSIAGHYWHVMTLLVR